MLWPQLGNCCHSCTSEYLCPINQFEWANKSTVDPTGQMYLLKLEAQAAGHECVKPWSGRLLNHACLVSNASSMHCQTASNILMCLPSHGLTLIPAAVQSSCCFLLALKKSRCTPSQPVRSIQGNPDLCRASTLLPPLSGQVSPLAASTFNACKPLA